MQRTEDSKIRVMRIINRFNIGGPTYNATFLTRYLSSDFETLLVGGLPEKDESDSLYILDNYGVQPHLIEEMKRKPSLVSDVKAFLRIRSMMKKFRPHIVHTHASKAGVLGRLAAISLGVPVVVHTFHGHVFHSYFSGWKTYVFKTIERILAKGSTVIIALSQLQKNELVQQHRITKDPKVVTISLGFDLARFRENKEENRRQIRERYSLGDDTVAVAIVGRLAPIKNHRLFLDMSRLVAESTTKKCVFFIVGDGSESEWIKAETEVLNANGNGMRWIMTSWVKDVAAFNAGMDIICLTSNNEGTPVSLIEAQAAGLPIVSTDVGGVNDIVKDHVTGVIVPPNDTKLFANALLELIENEKKRHFLSQNGWTHVEQSFHYTTLVNNMEQLYRKLIHEKRIKHDGA
jgi:glycosyltransferase involved in cell wall biosynthesis